MMDAQTAVPAENHSASNRPLRWVRWSGTLLAFLLSFATYVRTLAPTVYGLDSAELTTAAYCLGLVHPSGYPLYLVIAYVFTRLPLGNVGYCVNLMSAFFGALAVVLLYLLVLKLLRRPLVALATALLLAYSYFFWSPSVMAEVYTLHIFLMALLIWVLLIWQERRDSRLLYLLALLYGLSLGNHLSMLLLAPGILYGLLAVEPRRVLQPKCVLAMLALFALGLSIYLYLPLRSAGAPPAVGAAPGQIDSWQDIVNTISARMFWPLVFAYSWPELWGEIWNHIYCLWGNFLGVGLVLGALGAGVFWKRQRTLSITLGLMYLANTFFFIGYRVADKQLMFLPTYWIWALWIGWGYEWLLEQTAGLSQKATVRRRWQVGSSLLFLALALIALLVNFSEADLSDDWRVYLWADRIFDRVEPGAYVLAMEWFEIAPLEYLHVVEQRRPDVRVLYAGGLSLADLDRLVRKERGGFVYSTSTPGWLDALYRTEYIEDCNCYRVLGKEVVP